ncbi:MAG: aspartate carbamoyltransferase [Eubacteriales bacterium]|jgi:aspartate carbamoyltransferase catalytic subunit
MGIKHLIDFNDMSREEWEKLYALTCDIIDHPEKYAHACEGRLMATLFYEPSTRTMFSFQAAMQRLGGKIIGFSEPANSSVAKGEDLQDTIKIVSSYTDIVVMRNPIEGAAKAVSLYSSVPVVNAGDGGHLHPTQTLTDLTTIAKEKGHMDGLTVGMCGDLKNGRTVHSLIKALSRYENVTFVLVSPDNLKVPHYLVEMLQRKNLRCVETTDLDSVIGQLDILYMTRVQRERFVSMEEYERCKGIYILDTEKMSHAKPDMLVMHPMPIVDEITHEVDEDPRAVYFKQARYGMFVRMALIYSLIYKKIDIAEDDGQYIETNLSCTNPRCVCNIEHYLPHRFKAVKSNPDIAYCIYCEKQYSRNGEQHG